MKLLKSWILLSLLLSFLNCNAQDSFVIKVTHGYVVEVDTAVLMDITSYRNIRRGAMLYERLNSTDVEMISKYDSITSNFNNLVIANNLRLDILMHGINERDKVINQLNSNVDELASLNLETTKYVEDMQKKFRKPFLSPGFWVGLACGSVATIVLLR